MRKDHYIITIVSFAMRSFSKIIPQLLFVTGSGESHSIVKRIQLSSQNTESSEIFLSGVHVDIGIFHALVDVLARREWNGLHMAQCSGLIPELLKASSPLVEKLSILGDFLRMDSSWRQSLSRGLQLPNTYETEKVNATSSAVGRFGKGLG
jgi:hypothetical protein